MSHQTGIKCKFIVCFGLHELRINCSLRRYRKKHKNAKFDEMVCSYFVVNLIF